ncbi:MAG: zinc ribbon domain-containing protein [Anaerotignum sp.]|nr:zinc ribbon domain-containing protein [Anaerotignum sp.]MBR5816728.1 zinc ribbon domain-containing protein [Anaerotignum sp.]MBR6543057.1 zinc ribbon domain-containing protein [Anaerotignum sp.]
MNRVCKKCGGEVKMEDRFCMHCGMPLEEEPVKEEKIEEQFEEKADVLTMWEYLLILILMAIPVVNVIACIFWIVGKNGNPNRRNFAKAWMVLAVVGTLLGGVLTFGMTQFLMDPIVKWEQHIEYNIPQEQFMDDFLTELEEI